LKDARGDPAEQTMSFFGTFYSLLQMTIGANFPEAALPMFGASRWTGFIFLVFMSLTFVIFANLMMAVVYKGYQDHRTLEVKNFFVNRIDGLARGFQLLRVPHPVHESGVVEIDVFKSLFTRLVESPVRSHLRPENADYIFFALDEDGNGTLDLFEFYDLSENLLMLELCICKEDTWLVKTYDLVWFRIWLQSQWHSRVITAILIVNVVLSIYESVADIMKEPEPPWANAAEFMFSIIYLADVALKLSVISFRSYWSTSGSRFDFCTSVLLFVAACSSNCGLIHRKLVRYINIIRMLKLVMLLQKIPQFEFMFSCIVSIVLVCKEILVVLCLVCIFFGEIGVQAFGGSMYPSNPELAGSDFLRDNFIALNFNDMPMAMATLFTMLMMSYSPAHADALGRLAPWYPLGGVFCLAYYFIVVVIVFNILAAFTIDVFMALEDEAGADAAIHDANQIKAMCDMVEKDGLVAHRAKSTELLNHKITSALFKDTWHQIEGRRRRWEEEDVLHQGRDGEESMTESVRSRRKSRSVVQCADPQRPSSRGSERPSSPTSSRYNSEVH